MSDDSDKDEVIKMKFKGRSEVEAGYFYCPYIPLNGVFISAKEALKQEIEKIEREREQRKRDRNKTNFYKDL